MGRARPIPELRVDLCEFVLRLGVNLAVPREEDGARTGGSLIECKDKGHKQMMFSEGNVSHIFATVGKFCAKMPGIRMEMEGVSAVR